MALLSGKLIAGRILTKTKAQIVQSGVTPGLAVVLVGDYIESQKYVALKEERAKEIGVSFEKVLFPARIKVPSLSVTLLFATEGAVNAPAIFHSPAPVLNKPTPV